MRVSMHTVGKVTIESGQLVLGDPRNMPVRPDLCATVETGIGEGIFPVVVIEADGVRYIALRMAHELDGVMMSGAGRALIEAE